MPSTAGAVQSWLTAWDFQTHSAVLFAHAVFIQESFYRLFFLNFASGDTTGASHETWYDVL